MSSCRQRVDAIIDQTVGRDLSSWEKYEFLPNVRKAVTLSPAQERVLSGIEIRIKRQNDRESEEDSDELD